MFQLSFSSFVLIFLVLLGAHFRKLTSKFVETVTQLGFSFYELSSLSKGFKTVPLTFGKVIRSFTKSAVGQVSLYLSYYDALCSFVSNRL